MSENNIRILYVEDNPDDQLILKRSLNANMPILFDLIIVDTGTKGLKKVDKEQFDLIISDYRLPDISGIEFIKELQKKNVKTPVVLVTGKGNENIAVEAMKLGVRDYINKEEIGSKRLAESIKEIFLKTSLPLTVNVETARKIFSLFAKRNTITLESKNNLVTIPESEIPDEQLVSTLKALSDLKILEKEPFRTVIACPECGGITSTLYLECPECESNKMVKGEALEHFDCGNIDFRTNYDEGEGKQVCPKCGKRLKVIGVDYRKIENWYKCSNSHNFGQPNFRFVCSKCNGRFSFEETKMQMLNNYTMTSDGQYLLKLGIKSSELSEKPKKSVGIQKN